MIDILLLTWNLGVSVCEKLDILLLKQLRFFLLSKENYNSSLVTVLVSSLCICVFVLKFYTFSDGVVVTGCCLNTGKVDIQMINIFIID